MDVKARMRLFIALLICLAGIAWLFYPGSPAEARVLDIGASDTTASSVPKIFVRQDSVEMLMDSFLNIRNSSRTGAYFVKGNKWHINIARLSDVTEFINNPDLLSTKRQGFTLEEKPGGGLYAAFPIKTKEGIPYVELPTDILYRLLTDKD